MSTSPPTIIPSNSNIQDSEEPADDSDYHSSHQQVDTEALNLPNTSQHSANPDPMSSLQFQNPTSESPGSQFNGNNSDIVGSQQQELSSNHHQQISEQSQPAFMQAQHPIDFLSTAQNSDDYASQQPSLNIPYSSSTQPQIPEEEEDPSMSTALSTALAISSTSPADQFVQAYNSNVEDSDRIIELSPSGRYAKLNCVLGKGAYKVVYKAIDREEGFEVAWNCFQTTKAEFIELGEEIAILKRVRHPNIINFHDCWYQNNEFVFITELMTSGTLREYIRKLQNPNLKIVKRWCRQILKGLQYLHSHKPPIIHRDIKCDNIFINGAHGEVKIGDMGTAKMKIGKKYTVIGTPEFMAPEMYEEHGYSDKVDVYAFGMCLLEMITGEYPYSECTNAAQIYKKVTQGIRPECYQRLPPDSEARDLINQCLLPEEERITVKKALEHSFLAVEPEVQLLGIGTSRSRRQHAGTKSSSSEDDEDDDNDSDSDGDDDDYGSTGSSNEEDDEDDADDHGSQSGRGQGFSDKGFAVDDALDANRKNNAQNVPLASGANINESANGSGQTHGGRLSSMAKNPEVSGDGGNNNLPQSEEDDRWDFTGSSNEQQQTFNDNSLSKSSTQTSKPADDEWDFGEGENEKADEQNVPQGSKQQSKLQTTTTSSSAITSTSKKSGNRRRLPKKSSKKESTKSSKSRRKNGEDVVMGEGSVVGSDGGEFNEMMDHDLGSDDEVVIHGDEDDDHILTLQVTFRGTDKLSVKFQFNTESDTAEQVVAEMIEENVLPQSYQSHITHEINRILRDREKLLESARRRSKRKGAGRIILGKAKALTEEEHRQQQAVEDAFSSSMASGRHQRNKSVDGAPSHHGGSTEESWQLEQQSKHQNELERAKFEVRQAIERALQAEKKAELSEVRARLAEERFAAQSAGVGGGGGKLSQQQSADSRPQVNQSAHGHSMMNVDSTKQPSESGNDDNTLLSQSHYQQQRYHSLASSNSNLQYGNQQNQGASDVLGNSTTNTNSAHSSNSTISGEQVERIHRTNSGIPPPSLSTHPSHQQSQGQSAGSQHPAMSNEDLPSAGAPSSEAGNNLGLLSASTSSYSATSSVYQHPPSASSQSNQAPSSLLLSEYGDDQAIEDLVRDTAALNNRGPEKAQEWITRLHNQDLMTVGDLRDLHDEDWAGLGLTVFASRALRNALHGKSSRATSKAPSKPGTAISAATGSTNQSLAPQTNVTNTTKPVLESAPADRQPDNFGSLPKSSSNTSL